MAAKQIIFNVDARRKLERGVNIVAEAVKTTLGLRAATWCWRRSSAPRPSPRTA